MAERSHFSLLNRLHDVMAGTSPPQGRLDEIVQSIAVSMAAEVCSIYLARDQGRLELCATQGLKPESVHHTSLARGEGLVGDIALHARPLNLKDARAHPSFSHRPETGEEIYASFLGAPLLHNGRVVGVVAIQNRKPRSYPQEDVEILQTVAMVLAAFAAGSDLLEESKEGAPSEEISRRFQGKGWAEGVALGHVVLHEPRVRIERLFSADASAEHDRLNSAIYDLRRSLDRMIETADLSGAGAHRDILEAYRMFANDRGWLARIHETVETGLTAEASVARVQESLRAHFLHQSNPYLRDRLHDLDDLANRLLRHLTGATARAILPKDAILLARAMGPAELLDYDRDRLRGLALEEGAVHAHVNIVARTLGLPHAGSLSGLLHAAREGDDIIVDGDTGEVYLNPDQEVVRSYAAKARFRARRQARYRAAAEEPAVTKDGRRIELLMSAGLMADLPHLKESGAAGIGLFRTELQFMVSATMPRLKAQTDLYRTVLDAAGDKPVVFRTLDIGGDKVLPYMARLGMDRERGENPALGWRAIRIGLDRPGLLLYQLRALLAAARGRDLRVLFPMVTETSEFLAARALLDKEIARAKRLKRPLPKSIAVGAMLEVPALIWQMDSLLPKTDFLSIGSNDLFQFVFASDRNDSRLSDRYDILSPAGLRLLRDVRRACRKHQTPVTLCGEASGRALESLAMIGLGFEKIAMLPVSIGPVKAAIRAASAGDLEALMEEVCASSASNPRARLEDHARKAKIPIPGLNGP